jgi:antitoxin PrlF
MNGDASRNYSRPSRTRARARLRHKAQLTVPEEIRRALHVNEGDEVEFTVHEDGTITMRGYVSIPADQARLYATYQDGKAVEADTVVGLRTAHGSVEE